MKTTHIITITLLAILALAAITLLPGSCSVVPPGHRGVAVRLGKVSPELRGEGLAWKTPWLESIVPVSIQQWNATETTSCFSADLQTVEATYSVLYRLPENQVINVFQNYRGNLWDSVIGPRVREALKQILSRFKAEEIVKNREQIRGELLEKLRAAMGDLVSVTDTPITNIDLSDQIEKAIEKKQVEEQTALAKTYELQKEVKEAEITIVKAKAEAESVKIKGEALKHTPDVVALEIAKKWNGVSPTSVVTSQGGANVLLPIK